MTEIDQKSAKSLYFSCYYFNAVYFLEILILMSYQFTYVEGIHNFYLSSNSNVIFYAFYVTVFPLYLTVPRKTQLKETRNAKIRIYFSSECIYLQNIHLHELLTSN